MPKTQNIVDCLLQVLKNQEHILYFINSMKQAGNVSIGIYNEDRIGLELMEETQKLRQIVF